MNRKVMIPVAVLLLTVAGQVNAQWTDVEVVTIGNPGNTGYWTDNYMTDNDIVFCGGVDYVYEMGKYEITIDQYTAFLNAVAASDRYCLYKLSMRSQILRSGSQGSYTYSVVAGWENRPVAYVGFGDAARFCNWLHNGRPTGDEDLTTTEDGSYYLNGAMSHTELLPIAREPDATWVIPTEDEWTKAAYHKNDGATGNYWAYAIGRDSIPDGFLTSPDTGRTATYQYWDENTFSFYYTVGGPYYRTFVGEHENSDSAYGTFDQSGNVAEWTETTAELWTTHTIMHICRGGHWQTTGPMLEFDTDDMNKLNRRCVSPQSETSQIGFRVARLPATKAQTIEAQPATAATD